MISDMIRYLRKERGYTQEMLARKLHVTQGAISQWEKAITVPSADQLVSIADAFDISLDVLLERTKSDAEIESWKIRERVRTDPTYRLLFDAAGRASTENIRAATAMLKALEENQPK